MQNKSTHLKCVILENIEIDLLFSIIKKIFVELSTFLNNEFLISNFINE